MRTLTSMRTALAIVTVLLLATVRPGMAADSPGVTDTSVTVGVIGPITSQMAHLGSAIKTVSELLVKEVNQGGGIHGRQVKLVIEDEACSGTKARAAVNKLVLRDQVFALFGGSCAAAVVPVVPFIRDNKVPFVTPMVISETLTDPFSRYVFRAVIPATAIGRLMASYAVDQFHAQRIAIVNQDDEYGTGELKGSLLELQKRGLTPVAHETHKFGDTDFSAQALRLKQTNPQVVLIHSYVPSTAGIIRKAYELGVRAQYIAGVGSSSPRVIELLGEEPARGSYSAISAVVDPTGKMNPLTKDFVARYVKEYPEHGKRPGIPGPVEFQVLSAGMAFIEGLRRAGRDLTREKFVDALETIQDLKTGGYRSLTFTKTNHDGVLSTYFWYYDRDGKMRITDKYYTVD